ncbi:MAG: hypothetical protein A2Y24_02080 [Clostridiales bacterium GWE2_32_10]|nr:MAG: hypothetical protein A2Y24_02080 [Clostridiales bacterium GWE2_32_10]HBY20518.1 DUF192 domain-containing protein [Clostridiales bacterium]
MKLINITTNIIISTKVEIADTFFKRFIGLMGRKNMEREEVLVIKPCNNVHMFFMRFAIDVIFVDREDEICYIQENLKPRQISKYMYDAIYVIELPVDRVREKDIKVGDRLVIDLKK